MKILGIISVGFDVTEQLLIRFLHILDTKWEYNETVHQLFVDFKKAYDSVRREVFYNILIEFSVPMKVVRLIKMCLNETYSKVGIDKYLSDSFLTQNGLKQGDSLSPQLFKFALDSKTIILPVVLYGCGTCPPTLRGEHRTNVFGNRVLRRIFGPKRDEVTGEWRKLHNEELRDLYFPPSIIKMTM
jgi:hypothetical protein